MNSQTSAARRWYGMIKGILLTLIITLTLIAFVSKGFAGQIFTHILVNDEAKPTTPPPFQPDNNPEYWEKYVSGELWIPNGKTILIGVTNKYKPLWFKTVTFYWEANNKLSLSRSDPDGLWGIDNQPYWHKLIAKEIVAGSFKEKYDDVKKNGFMKLQLDISHNRLGNG